MDGELPDVDGVLESVGPRLRALRQQNNATLAQLSETTGISVSTLSRLESGQRKPTLELLLALARAHQVPLDELVGTAPTSDPRLHENSFVRHGITFFPLTRRPGGLRAYKQIFPPHWPDTDPDPRVHEGYEWAYVLSGQLRLILGEHDVILKPGEVVEFDTHVPHWFGNPGNVPCEVLALFGPQGERFHVRARPASS
ncbi:helix-turn-helix domain-containing protein [Amycolatopsis sp. DSM 110486]|uniref:helix-turn-helix domain-containing protein n=1 Tax=Amycolatopsis sp. DSM 110486 TaxID=2865832 RepID=UPI001C695A0A|nr:cupin domain-containing protein [Amycolatopsis sp. DSM 110486]QYN16491.1 cupin domain-containing protein [Amycolatopsis sp. DSM 110486]